jgi:hypothetical protein
MRLPSLQRLFDAARATAVRFPLVLLAGALAAAAAVALVHDAGDDEPFVRLIVTGQLGLPLLFALAVFGERAGRDAARRLVIPLIGAVALVAYWLAWAHWSEPVQLLRHAQLNLGTHLLAAFLPFLGAGRLNGFWHYNRTLFERFLTGMLFSLVLFVGLAIALAGVDRLLGVDVSERAYLDLWIAIAFVFHPWFFLGGVPRDLDALDARTDYPAGLKVFAQFILIPIVVVYLTILTAYLAKVLVTQQWPSGWIGYLVSSVAAIGMLSLLLVHPVADRDENRWVRIYSRWFYVALIPSIVMLLLAIWQRIAQYGVTEKRYVMVVLAVWLAGIAAHYSITRSRNIRLIPTTLCLLAFGTAFGPWGAYAVSRASQRQGLEELLVRNGILADGRIRPAAAEVTFEDRREISAKLRYLLETHGPGSIARWLPEGTPAADSGTAEPGPVSRAAADGIAARVMDRMGVEYVDRWATAGSDWFNAFAYQGEQLISVAGFTHAFRFAAPFPDTAVVDGRPYVFDVRSATAELVVSIGPDTLIALSLRPIVERARAERISGAGAPTDALLVEGETGRIRLALHVTAISGRDLARSAAGGAGIELSGMSAVAYFAVRQ